MVSWGSRIIRAEAPAQALVLDPPAACFLLRSFFHPGNPLRPSITNRPQGRLACRKGNKPHTGCSNTKTLTRMIIRTTRTTEGDEDKGSDRGIYLECSLSQRRE